MLLNGFPLVLRCQDLNSLRRLLQDMRDNAAAVICNHLRQAEKSAKHWSQKEAGRVGQKEMR